jgi:hypothetical protein
MQAPFKLRKPYKYMNILNKESASQIYIFYHVKNTNEYTRLKNSTGRMSFSVVWCLVDLV